MTPTARLVTFEPYRVRELEIADPTGDYCAVALSHVHWNPRRGFGAAGVGTVVATGPAAARLLGVRVIVPASVPASDERAAALEPVAHAGKSGERPDTVLVRGRWLCPLSGGLGLLGLEAALVGRELVEVYAGVARANVAPGDVMEIVGTGVVAQAAVRIALYRRAHPLLRTTDEALAELVRGWGIPDEQVDGVATGRSHTLDLRPHPEPAHPDLMPEVAALVVRGALSVECPVVVEASAARGELPAECIIALAASA